MATIDRATMIRKAIKPKTDKVTKIVDKIAQEGLDMLEESIGEILKKHKAYHFNRGTDSHMTLAAKLVTHITAAGVFGL